MNQSVECSTVMETGDEGSIDRISSLPDELLVQILSSLSTLDAVQTSLLSTRWRYLFTFTTNLSFDDQEYFRMHGRLWYNVDEALKTSFKRFVYEVLASNTISPIEKFSLVIGQTIREDCSDIYEWIRIAILKKVRHLHLNFSCHFSSFTLYFAFNSDTLVVLEIGYSGCLVVPELVFLPNLMTVQLRSIKFGDGDSAKNFFVGCPQLKELTLSCCDFRGDRVYISAEALQILRISWCQGHAVISAPNLINFKYECHSISDMVVTPSFKNSCPLDKAEFCFYSCELMSKMPKVVLDIITGTAHNIRVLSLMGRSLQLFTKVKEDQIVPYFKLGSLHLGFCKHDTWKYVTFLVANSPQLETIIFEVGLVDAYAVHEWPANLELAPFSSNVKTIEVHHFGGSKSELLLLKYLLENAKALKRLIIYKLETMRMDEELELRTELLMFLNASTDFRLEWETADKLG